MSDHNICVDPDQVQPNITSLYDDVKKYNSMFPHTVYRIRPYYRNVNLGFSKLLGNLVVKYVSTF